MRWQVIPILRYIMRATLNMQAQSIDEQRMLIPTSIMAQQSELEACGYLPHCNSKREGLSCNFPARLPTVWKFRWREMRWNSIDMYATYCQVGQSSRFWSRSSCDAWQVTAVHSCPDEVHNARHLSLSRAWIVQGKQHRQEHFTHISRMKESTRRSLNSLVSGAHILRRSFWE